MVRMGYKKGPNGIMDLLLVPNTGLEVDLVFRLLHSKNYPMQIRGEIILTDDCVAPQIVIFGNNVVLKTESREKNES